MGHDIYALDNEDEVAYLRRGAFNPLNKVIYEVLEAERYYGGVSGNGGQGTFNLKQIETAVEKLKVHPQLELCETEMEFLQECIDHCLTEGNVVISFG